MKFLIYGAGVIGSILAGKLLKAGYDVTVLARGKRFNELKEKGVLLKGTYSDKTGCCPVRVIDRLEPGDLYDYILVAMQKTQVDAVLPDLSKNKSPNLVFMVNNCLGYDSWAKAVGAKRLMLGFPSAGGERRDGVVTYFIGRGLIRLFQTTTFAEYRGERSARLKLLVYAFSKAGVPSVTVSDMDAWQKTHVSIVTAIGNALYKHGCDNYELSKSKEDLMLMASGIKEGFRVLKRNGIAVTPGKLWYFKLPDRMLAFVFRFIMNTKMAEITMAKHTIAARDEMRVLQADFDCLVRRSGLPTPHIDQLKKYL